MVTERTLRLCLAICLFVLPGGNVYGWGGKGHRIVALIAAEHLTSTARRQVNELLGGQSLASVATFADDVRNSRPETKNFHFVDIPKNKTVFSQTHDCPETDNGDCVIAAIARFKAVLGDTSKSRDERAEALKFIVHLVGDLHQPLHCSDNDDRGGNQVKVTFFGKRSNLHSVWDSGIIEQADLPDIEFADELEADLTPAMAITMQKGDVLDWVLEAHALAKTKAYGLVPSNKRLGAVYYNKTAGVVDTQLTKGGIRLSKMLNDVLK